MAAAFRLDEMNMTRVSPRQNDYAQNGSFVVVAVFRHPSHTKRPICRRSPLPSIPAFSNFLGTSQAKSLFLPSHSAASDFHLSKFFADLPCVNSIFVRVRLTPIRGTFHGPFCAILGSSWARLGPSWGRLGATLPHLGAVLRPSWGHLHSFSAVHTSCSL